MRPFEWNALKPGDRVLVHDDVGVRLELAEGVVTLVERRAAGNAVGIRLVAQQALVRPRRHAVHLLPLDRRVVCWRCDEVAADTRPPVPS